MKLCQWNEYSLYIGGRVCCRTMADCLHTLSPRYVVSSVSMINSYVAHAKWTYIYTHNHNNNNNRICIGRWKIVKFGVAVEDVCGYGGCMDDSCARVHVSVRHATCVLHQQPTCTTYIIVANPLFVQTMIIFR